MGLKFIRRWTFTT